MNTKTILSLCDYSGNWPHPYLLAGYDVILVDPKHREPYPPAARTEGRLYRYGMTVEELVHYLSAHHELEGQTHGIMAAPPCTHLSASGAQYWAAKDADGRTAEAVQTVRACLTIIERLGPVWWVLENPVGRLPKLIPELGKPWYFQPHWYGDPWTKKTGLWGNFNRDLPRRDVEPVRHTKQGSWTQKLGGSSERTKEQRSMTPHGFARAFFYANP